MRLQRQSVFELLLAFALFTGGICHASSFSIVHPFEPSPTGSSPYSGTTLSADGSTLYGTTTNGGTYNTGVLYKVGVDGSGYTILKSFSSADGYPYSGVTLSADDSTLYGTTYSGGMYNGGVVYKVGVDGSGYTVIKNFNFASHPQASITLSGDGSTLYGTTYSGGTNSVGVLYKVGVDGSGYTVLKNFSTADGSNPYSGVTLSGDGSSLYGMTSSGGTNNSGVLYNVSVDGSGYTVLKNFINAEGSTPRASVTLSGDASTLYGTTYTGGTNSGGVVYKVGVDGTGYTVLKNFSFASGANPQAGVTLSGDGSTLYGTTLAGGANNGGVVYKMGVDGTGYTVLKNFSTTKGYFPEAGVTLSGDGSTLYGTTLSGGANNGGVVYKVGVDGTGYTVLKNFISAEGSHPYAGVTLSGDGSTLYGTTRYLGMNDTGVLYKVGVDGSGYTVLKNFSSPEGYSSCTEVTLSGDGSTLYGTTYKGGANDVGMVYKVCVD